jgi:hypothetical protein
MQKTLATNADAEIILKLYELRTEPVMRLARAWITVDFWPNTADEFFAILNNFGSLHNAYLRQVVSYWEMAAALVLHGSLSADLFLDTNGEQFFILAKLAHILPEIQEQRPMYFSKTLRLIEGYSAAAHTYEAMCKNVEKRRLAQSAS